MLMAMRCDVCGKEFSWKNEECPVTHTHLVIETHLKPCEKCFHADTREKEYSFCSLKCLKRFVKNMKKLEVTIKVLTKKVKGV